MGVLNVKCIFRAGHLFSEGANWIPAHLTLHAQTTMAQFRQFTSPDLISSKNSRQDEVKYGGLAIHTAGGNAQNRNRIKVPNQEHCPRKNG